MASNTAVVTAMCALLCTQIAAASEVQQVAERSPDPERRANFERGYALCKQIVAVIFPYPADGIQKDHDQGGYQVSDDARTYSFTGFVRGPDRSEPHLRPYDFRNFRCTVTLDPDSNSGWTLDEFRWLQYQ